MLRPRCVASDQNFIEDLEERAVAIYAKPRIIMAQVEGSGNLPN
jgi:hypothetical protein